MGQYGCCLGGMSRYDCPLLASLREHLGGGLLPGAVEVGSSPPGPNNASNKTNDQNCLIHLSIYHICIYIKYIYTGFKISTDIRHPNVSEV